ARETRAGAKRGCLKQLCATTILKNAAGRKMVIGMMLLADRHDVISQSEPFCLNPPPALRLGLYLNHNSVE
ncbi:hypothetical protein ACK30V_05300, partial [Aeromonas caviae]